MRLNPHDQFSDIRSVEQADKCFGRFIEAVYQSVAIFYFSAQHPPAKSYCGGIKAGLVVEKIEAFEPNAPHEQIGEVAGTRYLAIRAVLRDEAA